MTRCRKLLGDMCDYVDGELPEELCADLERHLADCPNCRVMLDSLTKTVRVYREGVEEPLPDHLKRSLHAALTRRWGRKKKS